MDTGASTRVLRGRLGGTTTMLRHDPELIAARARRGLEARFLREADPDGVLSPQERERRAGLIRTQFYARLALQGVLARKRKSTPPPPARAGRRER